MKLDIFRGDLIDISAKTATLEPVFADPNDTEEAIWAFLSEAQLIGASEARKQFLQVRFSDYVFVSVIMFLGCVDPLNTNFR